MSASLRNRIGRLEQSAREEDDALTGSQAMIAELNSIREWSHATGFDLWRWCAAAASSFVEVGGLECEDGELRAGVQGELDRRGIVDPPGLRFYSLAGIVVDYGRHLVERRIEKAEHDEAWKLFNTPGFQAARDAANRNSIARRDPRLWDHATQTWRKNPPVDAVAREILFCADLFRP